MNVKVRIAPSPTGNLHIGTARTALFNWLFARHNNGQYIVRIEDTDLERSKPEFEKDILEGLGWLGLPSDTPIVRQTERLAIYKKYLEKLLAEEKAFWCHHSKEELEIEKKEQMGRKEAPRHLCVHKGTPMAKKEGQIIRLAVENLSRPTTFHDLIRGEISWDQRLLGDISLAKNLNTPLYNFAVVVDDLDMEISHIIRGEDHISNTPKQLLIYEALGAKAPEFAHMPLILNPDKSKLSKRSGATSVDEYKKDYLPEALTNFIGFLGYTYSKEIISKEEMAQEFEITKVHKSGAVFNVEKLNWINAQYIKKLSAKELGDLTGVEISERVLPLVNERLEKLSDIHQFSYLWAGPQYDGQLLIWKDKTKEEVIKSLETSRIILQKWDTPDRQVLKAELDKASNGNRGLIFWPLRVALSGKDKSPDPVELAFALGKDESIKRINEALEKLQ